MASSLEARVTGQVHDPFSSPGTAHQRYSDFNSQLFALNSDITPDRAKSALEAHLAETERRIQDASRLGTTLVQQRQDLADKLEEVEKQRGESDITPELRAKLAEIEKEFNEVGRETARTFMPRSRVVSGELGPGSPHAEALRSISPSKFESQATSSPSKLSVPNRRARNQPSNRVHDIEFATEISTSLLSQVRNLQGLLAEKEDILRDVQREKARLEREAEGFSERLRRLDESENRFKDENWALEAQTHEYIASLKQAADREKRLTQSLNLMQAEKGAAQKELDDIKLSHAKLVEDHTKVVKHHDAELGSVKRNMVMVENERGAMQRKIDELTGQNQELVKAVAHQHAQLKEHAQRGVFRDEDAQDVTDDGSPDHSPPVSPMKATPRHSLLETETLKSSLQHAHRMIQNLKGNIHREKTEKLELKRLLQDARDEVDVRRAELAVNNSAKRARRLDVKDKFKKPAPKLSQLGNFRRSESEVAMIDETNWEDEGSPSRTSPRIALLVDRAAGNDSSGDNFETANETSDAFETANERATETEDFQTGAEDMTDDNDMTETENNDRRRFAHNKKASSASLRDKRNSVDSTASASSNELSYDTPNHRSSGQRLRSRASRLSIRRTRLDSQDRDSPASYLNSSSRNGTPQNHGQSLFAELENLDDSEQDDNIYGSPTRSISNRGSVTPDTRPGTARTYSRPGTAKFNKPFPLEFPPPLPKPVMVDSGMMTDDWQPAAQESSVSAIPHVAEAAAAGAAGYYLGKDQESSAKAEPSHASTQWLDEDSFSDATAKRRPSGYSDSSAQYDPGMEEKLARFTSPPSSPKSETTASAATATPLTMSTILFEDLKPITPLATPLELSKIQTEQSAPVSPLSAPLRFSNIHVERLEPIDGPVAPLGISSIISEGWEPVSPAAAPLVMSQIERQISDPVTPVIPLKMSTILSEHSEPVLDDTGKTTLLAELAPLEVRKSALMAELTPLEDQKSALLAELAPLEDRKSALLAELALLADEIADKKKEIEGQKKDVQDQKKGNEAQKSALLAELALFERDFKIKKKGLEGQKRDIEDQKSALLAELALLEDRIQEKETALEVKPVAPPLTLGMSTILSEDSEPVAVERGISEPPTRVALPPPMTLGMSTIVSEHSEPVALERRISAAPTRAAPPPPPPASLSFSPIKAIGTEPVEPHVRSATGDGMAIPIRPDSRSQATARPVTPNAGFMGSVFNWGKNKTPSTPIIAEDSTRQSPSQSLESDTPDSQKPFKEISSNTDVRASKKQRIETFDESSQTALTAHQIEEMLNHRNKRQEAMVAEDKALKAARERRSQESVASVVQVRSKMSRPEYFHGSTQSNRPSSAASNRGSSSSSHPPLPSDHRRAIAAAAQRTGSSNGAVGTMGPPPLSASALRASQGNRPVTPTSQNYGTALVRDGTTPRASRAEVSSPSGFRSRASSISSFASELDTRFNMRNNALPMPHGLDSNTDPRMIQAITQTMIGEYLWKYTRKAGRGELSEKRHRRYFWVHPYTRTLYWSDIDPSQAGRSQLKAKSVAIEAVRVVTDDNIMPPGLHRKSIIIITPGRTVKFTAPTGQRHETWFNALSYLLLRTSDHDQETHDTAAAVEEALTQQDVDEFNPQPSIRSHRRAPPSRSSYASTHHTESSPMSASVRQALNPPSLHQSPSRPSPRNMQSNGSTLSRLSNIWKPGETRTTSSSRRSRASASASGSIYAASHRDSEAHDSAEELRLMIERQDREADRLENVRACCDGKHDVGSLSRNQRHSSVQSHTHRSGGRHTPGPGEIPPAVAE